MKNVIFLFDICNIFFIDNNYTILYLMKNKKGEYKHEILQLLSFFLNAIPILLQELGKDLIY